MLITWVFVPRKWPNWKLKSYLQTRTNTENFVKILKTSRPLGTNFWPKFEILTVLGAVFPHFRPDKREIWHRGRTGRTGDGPAVRSPVPNFTFIGATCRPCGAKNPFLDHYRHGCASHRPAGNKKDSGKLALRPDHPRRRTEVKVCMPGGLWCVVLYFEFY